MELKDIDLNLLVVFNELLVERSVSRVATKLGLSQPAVSNALGRLRKLVGEELFVRTSRGMDPTPHALTLAEPIADALSAIHATLNEATTFSASASKRRFSIGMTDIGEINFLPRLIEHLEKDAPGVSVTTLRPRQEGIAAAMESGHVDMSVGTLSGLSAGFFQRQLFKQPYVCLYKQGSAMDKASLSLDDYCAADHVVVIPPGSAHAVVDEAIDSSGIQRKVRISLPHWTAVGHILGSSNERLIATVPQTYAKLCKEQFGLAYSAHPLKLPEYAVSLFWHEKFHREAGNKWLRNLLFTLFADSTATSDAEVLH
jgi:DNA-binding transcriptional LysR family regulator